MSPRPSGNRENPETTGPSLIERAPDAAPRDTFRDGLFRDRTLPSLRAETGAALERQLLLVTAPGDESALPGTASRWRGRLVLGAVLATLAASSAFFFVEVRGHWKDRVAALEAEMDRSGKESAIREEALRREGAEKDRQISERKTENQNLSLLATKTMDELKAALDDLRRQREETVKLQAEVRSALETRPARWLEALAGLLRKLPPEPPPAAARPGAPGSE